MSMSYRFRIKRIDLAVQRPLVLGPGLVIDKIPYYCVQFTDGAIVGTGWGVSSPLWGGLKHLPLPEGIAKVEEWMLEFAPMLLGDLQNSNDPSQDLKRIHESLYDGKGTSAKGEPIPPLIRGMLLAPLEGAVCDYLAQKEGKTMVEFLKQRVAVDPGIFCEPQYQYLCPFLTISGNSTVDEVRENLARFKARPVVKFKVGSKGDPVAEAEFMNVLFKDILPESTLMVIDNNQAYSPEQCSALLSTLKDGGNLRRLLFIEQPFKRGEEPENIDMMFERIDPGIRIALDESVGSAADLERIAPLISSSYQERKNLIFIPKIEKGGLVEIVRMLEIARKLGIQVSPSTLTGPPPQIPQYWELFRQVSNVLGIPGVKGAFGMEANGYEILDWNDAVRELIAESEQGNAMFKEDEPLLQAGEQFSGAWPNESKLRPIDAITWNGKFECKSEREIREANLM